MLWLSLLLPHLPLEVFPAEGQRPTVVYSGTAGRQWVHSGNAAAAACGIGPGMSLQAALSLRADLRIHPRDETAEAEALHGLALWAGQFTSTVSLQPPNGLLLEIEGSLRLFAGLEPLCRHVDAGLREMGYVHRHAVAPTALGAWLLARAGHAEAVRDRQALSRALRGLPLSLLELPEETLAALRGVGLRRIGDCLRLPRAALARRLGPTLTDYLDRTLGRRPDPRPRFEPPERFAARVQLPAEVENSAALLFPLRRLVIELGGFLLARGCGVQELDIAFCKGSRPVSRLPVGLVAPNREPDHLLALVRERLEQHELPAAVDEVALRAERLLPLESSPRGLFAEVRSRGDWRRLVERLQARLGEDAVSGLDTRPEHRPEHAWRPCRPGEASGAARFSGRPLWLLERPEPLECSDGRPCFEGRLTLHEGPERIEGGWWDGEDVRRDYFVAETPQRRRLWVYRELRPPQHWFLHGVFG